MDDEELLWKQKTGKDWLAFWVRNTKYFYNQVNKRRKFNMIKSLRLEDGIWSFDEDRIKSTIIDFYKQIYTADMASVDSYSVRDSFPLLDSNFMMDLGRQVSL